MLLNLPPAHFRPDGNYTAGYADAAGSATRRRIAAALARSNGLTLATDWPLPILGLDCYVMDVPASQRADDVAMRSARDPRVAWAQPMNVFRPLSHDDPLFSLQPAAREWQLDELHAVATGRDVRVAVIDSGVQLDHPDLAGQVIGERELRRRSGRAGRDPRHRGGRHHRRPRRQPHRHRRRRAARPTPRVARLSPGRADRHLVHDPEPGDSRCMRRSNDGAQVINLSLGGPPDRLIEQLIDAALERGIGVVAAADRALPEGGFPAAVRGVVAVVDETSGAAPPGMVAAPGTDIPATLPGSRWATVSGASYAAAHVSGLLALMLEAQAEHERAARTGHACARDACRWSGRCLRQPAARRRGARLCQRRPSSPPRSRGPDVCRRGPVVRWGRALAGVVAGLAVASAGHAQLGAQRQRRFRLSLSRRVAERLAAEPAPDAQLRRGRALVRRRLGDPGAKLTGQDSYTQLLGLRRLVDAGLRGARVSSSVSTDPTSPAFRATTSPRRTSGLLGERWSARLYFAPDYYGQRGPDALRRAQHLPGAGRTEPALRPRRRAVSAAAAPSATPTARAAT